MRHPVYCISAKTRVPGFNVAEEASPALMAELEEVKQELATEKQSKYEIQEAYENAKKGWIKQDEEFQNLHQVISRNAGVIYNIQMANASLGNQVQMLTEELKVLQLHIQLYASAYFHCYRTLNMHVYGMLVVSRVETEDPEPKPHPQVSLTLPQNVPL